MVPQNSCDSGEAPLPLSLLLCVKYDYPSPHEGPPDTSLIKRIKRIKNVSQDLICT